MGASGRRSVGGVFHRSPPGEDEDESSARWEVVLHLFGFMKSFSLQPDALSWDFAVSVCEEPWRTRTADAGSKTRW